MDEVLANLEPSAPEWLDFFENKKKPVLGHDYGSGAPCASCECCPGLQLHFWRKKCKQCGCGLEDHLISNDSYPQYDIVFGDGRVRKAVANFKGRPTEFDWVPDAGDDRIGEYMLSLPENLRPITGSVGGIRRKQQLARQLPFYDILGEHFNESDAQAFQNYLTSLQKNAAGKGTIHKLNELSGNDIFRATPIWYMDPSSSESVDHRPQRAEALKANRASQAEESLKPEVCCHKCKVAFDGEEIVVRASRLDNALWHPGCFVCLTCEELLVDLFYYQHENSVYCGRDYATAAKLIRCFACDELIFDKEYTSANGKFYHLRHFSCSVCDEPLGGKQFVHKDENIMCPSCYEQEHSKICETCKTPISIFIQRIQIGKKVYHKTAECFKCDKCGKSLMELAVVFENGFIFCSKTCSQ